MCIFCQPTAPVLTKARQTGKINEYCKRRKRACKPIESD